MSMLPKKTAFIPAVIGLLLAISGCRAICQGTRRQIEALSAIPSRSIQGADRVPVSVPTVEESTAGLNGIHQLRSAKEGLEKQEENLMLP